MENTEKAVYISWFRTKSIHDYPSKIRTYLTEDGVICISQLFLFQRILKKLMDSLLNMKDLTNVYMKNYRYINLVRF